MGLLKIQCGSELARDSGTSITQIWIGYRHREQALLPQDKRSPIRNQVGYQAASGTPSLGEVPSGGAKAFCLLLTGPASGLFESDPPLGGTLSRRYRSNGYTHQNKYLKKPKKRRFPFLKEAPFFQASASSTAFFQQAQALW